MKAAQWRGGMLMAVALLTASACQKKPEPGDTAHAIPTPLPPPVRPAPRASTNAEIIAEAESLYTYGRERPQVAVTDTGFPGPYVANNDLLPRMSIATATLRDRTHRPSGRIIARIRSERAYPQAGIGAGDNFVWRSTWNTDTASATAWVTKIVSHDTSTKPYQLTRDGRRYEYTHGDPKEPRLVRVKVHSFGFGACFDDPMCPTGHCGYY